jgi:hypothetical protein
MNHSNSSANLQSNMFGAELARYYTDDGDNVEEIEAQSYPVETRFNRKRVRTMDDEDGPAIQTSIPAQSVPSQHTAKPKKSSNKKSTNPSIQPSFPPMNTQFTFSSAPTPHPATSMNHKPKKKERKKRNTKQLKEIQGRKGQSPINYSDLLRHFTMQINFMDLAQMSPNFAKNVRSLTTRVNEKKSKKKRSSDYTPPGSR